MRMSGRVLVLSWECCAKRVEEGEGISSSAFRLAVVPSFVYIVRVKLLHSSPFVETRERGPVSLGVFEEVARTRELFGSNARSRETVEGADGDGMSELVKGLPRDGSVMKEWTDGESESWRKRRAVSEGKESERARGGSLAGEAHPRVDQKG